MLVQVTTLYSDNQEIRFLITIGDINCAGKFSDNTLGYSLAKGIAFKGRAVTLTALLASPLSTQNTPSFIFKHIIVQSLAKHDDTPP